MIFTSNPSFSRQIKKTSKVMFIEEYHFGSITIDGKIYNHDVEARWTNKVLPFQFQQRHTFDVEAIKRAVEQNPKIIIIGTGESGLAKVTNEAVNFVKEKGIELIIDKTEEAIKIFNTANEQSIVGLFHLTC